jgi:hypothetical protein
MIINKDYAQSRVNGPGQEPPVQLEGSPPEPFQKAKGSSGNSYALFLQPVLQHKPCPGWSFTVLGDDLFLALTQDVVLLADLLECGEGLVQVRLFVPG